MAKALLQGLKFKKLNEIDKFDCIMFNTVNSYIILETGSLEMVKILLDQGLQDKVLYDCLCAW